MAVKTGKIESDYLHEVSAVILAAGKGTRMKSDIPKVLHEINGKPMISYVLKVAGKLMCNPIAVIVGYQEEKIRDYLTGKKVIFVSQKEQLGTGHAVLQSENALKQSENDVLILYGDMPLLSVQTLKEFIDDHMVSGSMLSILTTKAKDPTGYGRIVRDEDLKILKIVEEKDASDEEKTIAEINSGIYCVNKNFLFSTLRRLKPENKQGEYYLTDIVARAVGKGIEVNSFYAGDEREVIGVNTVDDLKKVEEIMSHAG